MKKAKFNLFLNPYVDFKFSKCPQCNKENKLRKHCLVTQYNDKPSNISSFLSINMTCKQCISCNLLIVDKHKLESYLQEMVVNNGMEYSPEDYFLFGTVDRKNWKKGMDTNISTNEFMGAIMPFKDSLHFEVQQAGWFPPE